MFVTHMGGPLEPTNVNRAWYAVRSRAQLGSLRLHDLRHSCASFLLAAGASPRTVMKTLGHSQIGLTMNTHTNSRVLHEAGEKRSAGHRGVGIAARGSGRPPSDQARLQSHPFRCRIRPLEGRGGWRAFFKRIEEGQGVGRLDSDARAGYSEGSNT